MSSATDEVLVEPFDQPRTRRDLMRAGAAAAIAGVFGVLGTAQIASAKNGSPLRAGERTTAGKTTTLDSKQGPALQVRSTPSGEGVGVRGIATGRKGVGISGVASSDKGETIGVLGEASSPDGVAGRFVAQSGGTAVEAKSNQKDGTALRTRGKVQFAGRSGTSQVSGGAEFVIEVEGGLGPNTFVLATLQDHHPGVHVESATVLDADADPGRIVVRLSQALAEPATVGWIVLD
jgi:hypothetical protein